MSYPSSVKTKTEKKTHLFSIRSASHCTDKADTRLSSMIHGVRADTPRQIAAINQCHDKIQRRNIVFAFTVFCLTICTASIFTQIRNSLSN